MKTAVNRISRHQAYGTPPWQEPRCDGCDCIPIRNLVQIAIPYGYVHLTARLCSDCRYRAAERDAGLLNRLARLVEREGG